MQLEWKSTESLLKPLEVDNYSSPAGVYLRRNIVETETDDGKKYAYDEAFLGAEFKFEASTIDEYLAKLLTALKAKAQAQSEKLYNETLNKPLPYENYFLLAEWITTYNNALATAQSLEKRGITEPFRVVVLSLTGLKNIMIYTAENFQPMFNIVSDEWARVTDKRNGFMVDIQNAKTIDELEAIEIIY